MTNDKKPLGIKPFLYGLAIGVLLVVGFNTAGHVVLIQVQPNAVQAMTMEVGE